jgi:hypothetical protein
MGNMRRAILVALTVTACGNTGGGGLSDGEHVDCRIADHWQLLVGKTCNITHGPAHGGFSGSVEIDPVTLKPGVLVPVLVDGGLDLASCAWYYCDSVTDAPPVDAGP